MMTEGSGSIQTPILVTPEQMRHSVVHTQDLIHQLNGDCSFAKDSAQVSIIM
jgi:hypothetical protein